MGVIFLGSMRVIYVLDDCDLSIHHMFSCRKGRVIPFGVYHLLSPGGLLISGGGRRFQTPSDRGGGHRFHTPSDGGGHRIHTPSNRGVIDS